MKRFPFTLEEHTNAGQKLSRINSELCSLIVSVSKAYGKNTKPTKYLHKALTAINHARSTLDDIVCDEYPKNENPDDTAIIGIYYPRKLEDTKGDEKMELVRMETEMKRINKALLDKPESPEYDRLYAAQQALAWALNPDLAKSPYDMIMGTQEVPEDCSGNSLPPQP